ncbi:MAG: DUF2726 domain-containing protein [Deltaproteobacteria bacterium]|nr:DUF2726 domain-containing protein [Deltaproteobacteria bacterium]
MGVRKTVFGSNEEKKYYRKLQKTWGQKLNIYHNIPFLNVFTARDELIDENGRIFKITEEEYDKLKKTSIDFVICDKKDKPIACVEFDGLLQGFNVGTNYIISEEKVDRKGRRDFLELKLRVAHGSSFPYFILGSEQFKGLSGSVYLTIADALIGEVLSTQELIRAINLGFNPTDCGYSEEEFDQLDHFQKRTIIEDWFLNVEIEADYKNNPVFQEVAKLMTETKSSGFSIIFLNENERDSEIWTWVECKVRNHIYGDASAKVYLPNFNTPSCHFSAHIAIEVAKLLALSQIKERKNANKRVHLTAIPLHPSGLRHVGK